MEKWEAAQDYFVSLRSNEEDGMNGSVAETRDILSLKASGDMFTSAKRCANDDEDGPHCAEVNDGQVSQMSYTTYSMCSMSTVLNQPVVQTSVAHAVEATTRMLSERRWSPQLQCPKIFIRCHYACTNLLPGGKICGS